MIFPPEMFNLCQTCRTYPNIDEEICMGCGQCCDNCPCCALELKEEKGEIKSLCFTGNCTGCRICEDICPRAAIS